MRYAFAPPFRQALEARLGAASRAGGPSLARLRKEVVFDRLLARLVAVAPDRWRKVAARVCDEVLPAPGGDAAVTRLQAVLEERTDTWVHQGRPAELRAWRAAARAGMEGFDAGTIDASETAASIAPMRWLLEPCRDGVPLTQALYLPRTPVQEAADQFDWWPFPGRPRSEVDIHQLGVLRDTATREAIER